MTLSVDAWPAREAERTDVWDWLAFGLAKPDQDPVALLSAAYDDQVAAFYAPEEKTLLLRRQYPAALG